MSRSDAMAQFEDYTIHEIRRHVGKAIGLLLTTCESVDADMGASRRELEELIGLPIDEVIADLQRIDRILYDDMREEDYR